MAPSEKKDTDTKGRNGGGRSRRTAAVRKTSKSEAPGKGASAPATRKRAPAAAAAPRAETAAELHLAPVAADPRGISSAERHRMIAQAAYLRAERRRFQGGSPERDWHEAEAEIDAMLLRRARTTE